MEASLFIWAAFRMVYLREPVNEIISVTAFDIPDIRPEAFAGDRTVGIHYFGDFLQTFDWTYINNPWSDYPEFLASYPPMAVYLLKVLSPLPYFWALGIYLTCMLVSAVFIIWRLASSFAPVQRITLSAGLGLFSAPILMAFDRGNSVGFLVLLFGLFLIGIRDEIRWLAVLSLTLMATIKIYPLLLIFVLIRNKWWREVLATIFLGFTSTLVLFFVTPGNIFQTISMWWKANTAASDYWNLILGDGMSSLLAYFQISDLSVVNTVTAIVLASWAPIRYLFIGLLIYVICFSRRVSTLESIGLAGFSMMLLYSGPHNYAWTWALPFIAVLLDEFNKLGASTKLVDIWNSSKIKTLSLFGLLLIVLPLPISVPGTQKSIAPFLGYILIFLLTSYYLQQMRRDGKVSL
jgi:hypothetical protein